MKLKLLILGTILIWILVAYQLNNLWNSYQKYLDSVELLEKLTEQLKETPSKNKTIKI